MLKKLIAIVIMTASFTVHSQTGKQKVKQTFAEPREVKTQSDYKHHFGATFGFDNPHGDLDSSPEFGFNFGFQSYIPFGVGLDVITTELDNTDIQKTSVLARATYNFAGQIPVIKTAYIGLTSGAVFIDSEIEMAIGPVLGFDIPLSEKRREFFSLGLDTKYLMITDIQDSFSAALALKYWF